MLHVGIGVITLFFDTVGIGNYAPATAIFRMLRLVHVEDIQGTLNVGSAVPVAVRRVDLHRARGGR